jgi:hypothetical protein
MIKIIMVSRVGNVSKWHELLKALQHHVYRCDLYTRRYNHCHAFCIYINLVPPVATLETEYIYFSTISVKLRFCICYMSVTSLRSLFLLILTSIIFFFLLLVIIIIVVLKELVQLKDVFDTPQKYWCPLMDFSWLQIQHSSRPR